MTKPAEYTEAMADSPLQDLTDATEPNDPGTRRERLPAWVRGTKLLSLALAVPAAVACTALMLHVIADVVGRTFFNHPVPGTLETAEHWWMITIVFAALGYSQVRGDNVRATAVVELLSPGWQRFAEIVTTAMLGVVALLLAWYSWQAASHSYEIREATSSSPPVSIWPFLFFMPVGGIALALQSVASIYEVAKDVPRYSHAEGLI